jgi:hypothetical protein
MPPDGSGNSPIVIRKRVRAQVRAETLVAAAHARRDRILAQAREESEQIINASHQRVEAALSRGFDTGLSNGYDALSGYWLDSFALNHALLERTTASLQALLSEKMSSPSIVSSIVASLIEHQSDLQNQLISLALPETMLVHADQFVRQLKEHGLQVHIHKSDRPHTVVIDWGAHTWTFDASSFVTQMIDSALGDASASAVTRTSSEQQTARALRGLADKLNPQ